MEITKKWLEEKEACLDGLNWFLNQSETDLYRIIDKLIEEQHENWANWLITRAMSRQQQLQCAITFAELVLPIFEKEYPGDNRPRASIATAKKILLEDSQENRDAAQVAACEAAEAACEATWAARGAAEAAWAAWAAREAACGAAREAAEAAEAAWAALDWKPILEIGINILKGK